MLSRLDQANVPTRNDIQFRMHVPAASGSVFRLDKVACFVLHVFLMLLDVTAQSVLMLFRDRRAGRCSRGSTKSLSAGQRFQSRLN